MKKLLVSIAFVLTASSAFAFSPAYDAFRCDNMPASQSDVPFNETFEKVKSEGHIASECNEPTPSYWHNRKKSRLEATYIVRCGDQRLAVVVASDCFRGEWEVENVVLTTKQEILSRARSR